MSVCIKHNPDFNYYGYSEQIRVREQRVEELAEKRLQIVLEAERAKRQELGMTIDQDDEWVSSVYLHQEKVKVEVSVQVVPI